ncbi:16S rRNA (guanine(966)-N(2))-methyltransferase RsmD [Candidatus Margulisiibacteriota bacterium]
MRIISGKYKGLRLYFSKTEKLRPTADRVKESLFNIINDSISEALVLDLFAGTGSLGYEAYSRGAKKVVLVDIDDKVLKKNLMLLMQKDAQDVQSKIKVIKAPFFRFLKQNTTKFDLIFIDPPWNKISYYDDALKAISEFDILAPEGLICLEHRKNIIIQPNFPLLRFIDSYHYGDTCLTILKKLTAKNKAND